MPSTPSVAHAVAALCLAAAAPFAHASFSVYTDESSFRAAIDASSTDNFADLPAGVLDTSMTRSAGSFGYAVSVALDDGSAEGLYSIGPDASSDVWLSSNSNRMPIVFAAFAGGVQAIGGYFFATDANGASLADAPLTVTAADASGSVGRTLVSQSPTSFLGFVSDTRLDSLQVSVLFPDNVPSAWATVNNLTLGQAQTQALAPVPEPSTYALMLAGLAVVARVTTRRRPRG